MFSQLQDSPLFAGMAEADIHSCLSCSRSEIASYEKDEFIFRQQDQPRKLMVLLEGAVAVCSDSASGRRNIVASFRTPGDLFGEVYVFLGRKTYDHYAQAVSPAKILLIPREFLFHTCDNSCGSHEQLISNMLAILAQKAYHLNQKLQILSCATLRQKIAAVLLQNSDAAGQVTLPMGREALADFLNVARPSLSRELMRMQSDGLIQINRRTFFIPDRNALENLQ